MTAGIAAAPAYVPLPAEGRYRRVLAAVRAAARRGLRFKLRCLVLGHEDSFARQPRRLMLRCATCGRETVGWTIGPSAASAAVATPFSRLTAGAPGPRARSWGLGPWRARADAGDRQRLRLVLAAARAAERRSDDAGRAASRPDEGATRLRRAEPQPDHWTETTRRGRAGLGDYSRAADGSAPPSPVKPQVRWVPSQNGLRDEWPQRHDATGRRSIM